jgi:hypothetical protein
MFTKGDISGTLPEVPVILRWGAFVSRFFLAISCRAVSWPHRRPDDWLGDAGAGGWSRSAVSEANANALSEASAVGRCCL